MPKQVTEYECEHCGKRFPGTQKVCCLNHEHVCYCNPKNKHLKPPPRPPESVKRPGWLI